MNYELRTLFIGIAECGIKPGNIRTTEQQKKEKPKPEWFEHPKLRSSTKQAGEKLRSGNC
jgi:hypothetical protein